MPSYAVYLIAAAVSAIICAVVTVLMRPKESKIDEIVGLKDRLDRCEQRLETQLKPAIGGNQPARKSPTTSQLQSVHEKYDQLQAEMAAQSDEIAFLRKDLAAVRSELTALRQQPPTAAVVAAETEPARMTPIREVVENLRRSAAETVTEPPAAESSLPLVEEFDRADQSTNRNLDRMRAYFQKSLGSSLVKFEESEGVALFHMKDGIRAVPFRNTRLAERWQRSFDVSGGYNRPIEKVLTPALFEQQDDGGLRLLQKGSIAND